MILGKRASGFPVGTHAVLRACRAFIDLSSSVSILQRLLAWPCLYA